MEIIELINSVLIVLQIIIIGAIFYGAWALSAYLWKVKEDGNYKGWFEGWRLGVLFAIYGFFIWIFLSEFGLDIPLYRAEE